jgi:hypothetical protein
MVGDTDNEVGTVFVSARMFCKGKFRTADNSRAIGGGEDDVMLSVQFLNAQPGVSFTIVAWFLVSEIRGEIVDFKSRVGMPLVLGAAAEQAGFGALEVKIINLVSAGLDLPRSRPGKDVAFGVTGRLGGGAVFERFVAGIFGMRALGVSEFELMLDDAALIEVFKKIVDTLLLHEATDEIEIGLPILNTMIEFPVAAGERGGNVVEAVVLEELFQDSRDGHFVRRLGHGGMKNPAISSAGQKPEPRHNGGLVAVKSIGAGTLHEGTDVAAETALLFLGRLLGHAPPNRDTCADYLKEIQGRFLAEQVSLHYERAAQLLTDGNTFQQQFVFAQRRLDSDRTIVLSVLH